MNQLKLLNPVRFDDGVDSVHLVHSVIAVATAIQSSFDPDQEAERTDRPLKCATVLRDPYILPSSTPFKNQPP